MPSWLAVYRVAAQLLHRFYTSLNKYLALRSRRFVLQTKKVALVFVSYCREVTKARAWWCCHWIVPAQAPLCEHYCDNGSAKPSVQSCSKAELFFFQILSFQRKKILTLQQIRKKHGQFNPVCLKEDLNNCVPNSWAGGRQEGYKKPN